MTDKFLFKFKKEKKLKLKGDLMLLLNLNKECLTQRESPISKKITPRQIPKQQELIISHTKKNSLDTLYKTINS
jgi:hypothetical protein